MTNFLRRVITSRGHGLAAATLALAISASPASSTQVNLKYLSSRAEPTPSELAAAKPVTLPTLTREQLKAAGVIGSGGSVVLPTKVGTLTGTSSLLSRGQVGGPTSNIAITVMKGGNVSASVAAASAEESDSSVAPMNYGSVGFPFATSRVELTGKLSSSKVYPYRASGKLVFKLADGNVGTCSASLIRKGILVTAAHCVAQYGVGYQNASYTFYPGFFNGKAPYGSATAIALGVLPSYLNGTDCIDGVICLNDVAVVVLAPKGSKYIGSKTGWLNVGVDGWGFTSEGKTHVTQLGYPAGIDAANQMIRNDSLAELTDETLAWNVVLGTQMNQGSSGGPWINNFGVPGALSGVDAGFAPVPNVIVGVTSWGVPNSPTLFAAASPFTSGNIGVLLNAACTAFPLACAP